MHDGQGVKERHELPLLFAIFEKQLPFSSSSRSAWRPSSHTVVTSSDPIIFRKMKEDNSYANEHHGDAQGGNSTGDVDQQPDQLDSAVMDSLIKRAEAEAAQQYHDEAQQYRDKESNAKKAQVEDKKQVSTKRETTSTPSHGKGNQKAQQRQVKQYATSEIRQGGGGEASEEIRKVVAEQAGLTMAEHLQEEEEDIKKAYKTTPNQNPIHKAPEINEPVQMRFLAKKSKEAYETTPNQHLLQMATEINESATMEKLAKNSEGTTRREPVATGNTHQQGETIPQTTMSQTSQLSPRPGAYMGAPGEALLRANTLRFSLVGASGTTGQGDLVQVDDPVDPSVVEEPNPALASINHETRDNQQLAVANPVLDDPDEEQMRPLANPVDLQQVAEREQKRTRLRQVYILYVVILIIVAAIVVGTVVGTQRNEEPDIVVIRSTETPTIYGSMEPSAAPSSAPTGVLELLLDNLPIQTLARINNGSETPQWRAWQWLVNHQNITFLPEWRKEQLFALATFYYAFEGENWNPLIKGHGWMDDTVEECNWFSSGFGYFDGEGKFIEDALQSPCNSHGKFTALWLNELQLSGLTPSFPAEITMLTSLSHLEFVYNDIETSISSLFPAELYEMTALTGLLFLNEQVTGQLPSELGELTALEHLWFFRTQLTGPLPSELGRLSNVSHFWFSENQLTGPVPSELGQLTNLDWLHLSKNRITGQIPSEFGQLISLTILGLDENQLTGPVPSEFGLLTNLVYLDLTGNLGLSGTIPEELCFLQNVSCMYGPVWIAQPCYLGFDCTSVLCGCDCACSN
ncbi:expressed unknown protein [Seminavis robusta]|uniref:L domain-like protein n=1 Tax=Seminavis robusta TaxID=568900 RepID=A0A9N8F1L2_9STRA|nr:expressed unknown protein [Seminavis robusta]|eukprot:Sro3164_g344651.1  (802) ;mRNA; r:764-3169